jgi:hypothetical protein
MAEEDRTDLRRFVDEFRELMEEVTDGRHPGLIPSEYRGELRQAFEELAGVFAQVSNALLDPAIETSAVPPARLSLTGADLIGPSRERKISAFRRGLARFRGRATHKTLGRALRWANMILGSLATVIPPAEALKELKEYAENLNMDAEEDGPSRPDAG